MLIDDLADGLARASGELGRLFLELEVMKTMGGQVRTERIMRPTPGPRSPGNAAAIELCVDVESMLLEICCDLRDRVEPGRWLAPNGAGLADWLRFNAALVAEVEFAEDVLEELRRFCSMLDRYLGPPPEPDVARPEPRQFAPVICQRLAGIGYRVSPDMLRQWARRSEGSVSVELRGGKSTYLLTEVVAYAINRKSV